VADDRHEAIYVLAITTGMRQGEILGLRWKDIDRGENAVQAHPTTALGRDDGHAHLYRRDGTGASRPPLERPRSGDGDGGAALQAGASTLPSGGVFGGEDVADRVERRPATLEVRRTLSWLHGRAFLTDTKTERSHRTLTLPRIAVDALERRRVAQETDRAVAAEWADHDLVFTDRDGFAIERTVITRAFQRHLKALGLPLVPFHSLRKTATGWMFDMGLSLREIADVLGHSKPSQTSDTYHHLEDKASKRAAALFDEDLS
jgi:integrase